MPGSQCFLALDYVNVTDAEATTTLSYETASAEYPSSAEESQTGAGDSSGSAVPVIIGPPFHQNPLFQSWSEADLLSCFCLSRIWTLSRWRCRWWHRSSPVPRGRYRALAALAQEKRALQNAASVRQQEKPVGRRRRVRQRSRHATATAAPVRQLKLQQRRQSCCYPCRSSCRATGPSRPASATTGAAAAADDGRRPTPRLAQQPASTGVLLRKCRCCSDISRLCKRTLFRSQGEQQCHLGLHEQRRACSNQW